MGKVANEATYENLISRIAPALRSARESAFEEAAQIAESHLELAAVFHKDIPAAIRARIGNGK